MGDAAPEGTAGFVAVTYKDGGWKTAEGIAVPWYEVHTDLLANADVEAALSRVLSVYGVSDVVVDAFHEFRKELQSPADPRE